MMKKTFLTLTLTTLSIAASYSDAEKIQNKLLFITEQKEMLYQLTAESEIIYLNAQAIAQQTLQDSFDSINEKIELVTDTIIASEEFAHYNDYSTAFKSSLIANSSIKAKHIPILKPDQSLISKISEIVTNVIPPKLLKRIDVLTLFETRLDYKFNVIETETIIEKLEPAEKQLNSWLTALETGNNPATIAQK